MNHSLFSLVVSTFLIAGAKADTILVESFAYEPGELLAEVEPPEVWPANWKATADLDEDLDATYSVPDGGLRSAAFESNGLAPEGNGFMSPDSTQRAELFRELGYEFNWGRDGVLYVSFLAAWSGNHPSQSSRIVLNLIERNSAGDILVGGNYVGLMGTGEQDFLRLVARNQNETVYGEEQYLAGDVYFIVAKLDANPGREIDVMAVNVYSSADEVPSEEPSEWDVVAENSRYGVMDRIGFAMQVYLLNREVAVDELRIGDSWEAVIAAPVE